MDVYSKSQNTRITTLGRGLLPNNFIAITIVLLTLNINSGGVAGRAHPLPLQFLGILSWMGSTESGGKLHLLG